jgi:hypothetical protein
MTLSKTDFPLDSTTNRAVINKGFQVPGGPWGDIRFVHHAGSSTGPGWTPAQAYSTIDAAIGVCTANNNDLIVVCPGHAETLSAAAGIDADVAGITIMGIGQGSVKPTITLGTVVGTDVDIDAANVTIKGLRFVSNIDSLTTFIDCNSDYFTLEDCDFITSSAKEAVCFVDLATTKDWLTVRGCKFIQPTDPAGTDGDAGTGCFYFVDSEYLFFENCFFDGAFESAIWHNKTTAATNVWIRDCWGRQSLTAAEVFIQVANMSGGIHNSLITVVGATDVMEANVTGTLAANFFVSTTTSFGNDGGGGQGALKIAGDAS